MSEYRVKGSIDLRNTGYWVASLGVRPESWFRMQIYANWMIVLEEQHRHYSWDGTYVGNLSRLPFPLSGRELIWSESHDLGTYSCTDTDFRTSAHEGRFQDSWGQCIVRIPSSDERRQSIVHRLPMALVREYDKERTTVLEVYFHPSAILVPCKDSGREASYPTSRNKNVLSLELMI